MANQVTDRITVGIPGERGPIGPRGPEGPQGPRGPAGPAGAGNIDSVNGQTGPDVVLTASDVNAVPLTQFATTSQRGIVQLATAAEGNAGTDNEKSVTPLILATRGVMRYERAATTLAGLGTAAYVGQTAFLTIGGSFRVQVVWTGVRWEPTSWRLSGTTAQRNLFTNQGIAYDGMVWYNTSDNTEYVRSGGAWVASVANEYEEVALSTVSPWQPDSSYPPRAIRVSGIVYLEGRVSGSLGTGTIFTLPARFRPATLQFFVQDRGSFASISRVLVDPDGAVSQPSTSASNAAAALALTGINYPASRSS